MATIDLRGCDVVGTISGNSPEIREYPEAASQDFKLGDFVYLVNGKVTVCGADPSSILGIALKDATETEDSSIPVALANRDTLFEANIYYDANGSDESNNALAAADIGKKYGIVKSAAGKWYIDKTDTSNTRIIIRDKVDDIGDYYARVIFQVMVKNFQLDAVS